MAAFEISSQPQPFQTDSLLMVINRDTILVTKQGLPFHSSVTFKLTAEDRKNCLYIGEYKGKALYGLTHDSLEHNTLSYQPLFTQLDTADEDTIKAIFRACQLLTWHKQSNFCGCCGSKMHLSQREFAKICNKNPQHKQYPTYSPAMIVLVRRGNELLLGRSHHFRKGMYSPLSGFIEAGETGQDAVRRELNEEVGIEVEEIRCVGAYPWPFPNSIMLAYVADYKSGKLTPDPKEIEDAQWFRYDQLPEVLPYRFTIAYKLIQEGVQQCQSLNNNTNTLSYMAQITGVASLSTLAQTWIRRVPVGTMQLPKIPAKLIQLPKMPAQLMLALALPAQLWMYEQRTSDLLTFTPLQHLGLTTVTATATELGLHAVGLKGTGVAVVSTSLLGVYRYSKEQFLTSGQKNAQQARNQAALAAGAAYSAMTTTRNTFNLYRHGTVAHSHRP